MTKNKKEKLLNDYEVLFSLFQEVELSNYFYGSSCSAADRERKNKAEDAFIKAFVEIKCKLEDL